MRPQTSSASGRPGRAGRAAPADTTTRPDTREWVVTAPYQRSRSMPRATPWGTVHLKRVGGRFTACGLSTVGWHAFWELTFSSGSRDACRACARLIHSHAGAAEAGRTDQRTSVCEGGSW